MFLYRNTSAACSFTIVINYFTTYAIEIEMSDGILSLIGTAHNRSFLSVKGCAKLIWRTLGCVRGIISRVFTSLLWYFRKNNEAMEPVLANWFCDRVSLEAHSALPPNFRSFNATKGTEETTLCACHGLWFRSGLHCIKVHFPLHNFCTVFPMYTVYTLTDLHKYFESIH